MESEKVKEIKESLQQEYPTVKFLDGCIAVIVSPDLLKDCLTLINELESEKDKHKKLYETMYKKYAKLEAETYKKEDVSELKDRIVELENIGLNEDITVAEYLRELERLKKDNELLRNAKVVYENVDYCYEDLKKAEKKIAELEKENAKLLDSVETVQSNRCTTKCELTKKALKQFIKKFELNIGKHLKKKYSDYQQDSFYYIVDKADVDMCLDETLKECLCDNNQ